MFGPYLKGVVGQCVICMHALIVLSFSLFGLLAAPLVVGGGESRAIAMGEGSPIYQRFSADDGPFLDSFETIARGPEGLMFFGSQQGLYEFDGATWRNYSLGGGPVLDLSFGGDGKLYLGRFQDFGVLEVDGRGSLEYRALNETMPQGHENERVFIKVFPTSQGVFGATPTNLFVAPLEGGRPGW